MTSVYSYEKTVKSALYRFKGVADVALRDIFFGYFSELLRTKYRGYGLVLAPSSLSHDEKRGFNQVREMVKVLNLPTIDCIQKAGESKQSDLSVAERAKVGESLFWVKGTSVRGRKILLVDDVYTTGSTIKACLNLVKKHGAAKIEVLVMSRTPWKGG